MALKFSFAKFSTHIVEMCLNVVRVSIDLDSYNHVRTYVPKAEDALLKSEDKRCVPSVHNAFFMCFSISTSLVL